ncbi:phospholipid transfer protein-like [Xiphias gladius]|uniref:phospholipid transfer protein-like n=1 Tax=Xiphias gladius TaxID=8245 RepID=UPI001A98E8DC|nr:phospholipid transfer protein-like [Xiphias gladius]
MTSCVFSLLFLVSFPSITAGDPTGLKVRITDRAQDVLKDLGLTFLEELVNSTIPSFPITWESIKCTVINLTLTHLEVDPALTVVRFQDRGVQFEITNLDITWELQYDINLCLLQRVLKMDSRKATVFGHRVNATIALTLMRNQQGGLSVDMTNCQTSIDKLATKFSGILGPVIDAFVAAPFAQKYLVSKLCPAVQMYAVPQINSMLADRTMVTQVSNTNISIDYSLSGDITVTSNALDVPFKGMIFRQGEPVDISSIRKGADPVFSENENMAYVGISEFFFNSAAMWLYKSGPFQFEYPQVKWFVKGILKTVGLPEAPIQVHLTEAPTISIKETGLSIDVKAMAQSLKETPPSPLPGNCHIDMNVAIKESSLTLISKNIRCEVNHTHWSGKFVVRKCCCNHQKHLLIII